MQRVGKREKASTIPAGLAGRTSASWLSCASLHLSRALSATPTLGCLAFLTLSQRNEAELRVRATDDGVCSLLIGTRASACGSTRRPGPGQLHALVLAKASTVLVTVSPMPLRYSMQDAERRTHARAAERAHWHAGETHCAASRSRRPVDCAS